jgi:hypothetical protein
MMLARIMVLMLFSLLSAGYAHGQTSTKAFDRNLSDMYRQLLNAEYDKRYDSLAPAFKRNLIRYLSSPITLINSLDTLETLITIRQSPDKKVKFYSWDELTGGTWHEINSFVQFRSTGGKVLYRQLDTDKEMDDGGYTDSEIYEVHEIKEGLVTYYLAFGWGTHGSGSQHQVVYLFKIDGDRFVKCEAFNDKETELVFEYPRSDKLNLEYDDVTKTLSFDDFISNENEQLPRKSGKRTKLQFAKGRFR